MRAAAALDPKALVEIALPRVDCLTVSELDDIRAIKSRHIDTKRADFAALLRRSPPRRLPAPMSGFRSGQPADIVTPTGWLACPPRRWPI